MEDSFLALQQEVGSSKDLRTCIEKIIKIFRNIVHNPEENKYRTLRTGNKTFNECIWKFDAAQQMMMDCGWILDGDNIVLPSDEDLTVPLHFLLENREVKPSEKEWVPETKHVIPNEDKEKERQLRREAFAKKEKEMAELQKDMAEREAIKVRILAEHRHDVEKRKLPAGGRYRDFDQPAPATNMNSGAVAQPRRSSSSNVLGGSGGPSSSSMHAAGTVSLPQTTAHRRATTFSRPPTYPSHQQPAGNTYYPASYASERHATGRAVQRHTDGGDDEAPLRLNRGPAAMKGYGGRNNYERDQYYGRDDDGDYEERSYY